MKIEKNSKIKKIIIISAISIILLIISMGIVYAYLTGNSEKENNIILGYNKILLEENYDPPLEMQKGIEFTKEPYVTNVGNVDCYVRIKSVVSNSKVADSIIIDYNTTDYYYDETDGYWYYKYTLEPGDTTESLFTKVVVKEDADDIVLDGFEIYVYAESIQTVEGQTMQQLWN